MCCKAQEVCLCRPDLIINSHAFPSRMTIGMLLESLRSKAGALTGSFVDATPFQRAAGKSEDPIDNVAHTLEGFGFHRHGGTTLPKNFLPSYLEYHPVSTMRKCSTKPLG